MAGIPEEGDCVACSLSPHSLPQARLRCTKLAVTGHSPHGTYSCSWNFHLFLATSFYSPPSTEGEARSVVVDVSALPSDGKNLVTYQSGLDLNGDRQLMTSTGWPPCMLHFPMGKQSHSDTMIAEQNLEPQQLQGHERHLFVLRMLVAAAFWCSEPPCPSLAYQNTSSEEISCRRGLHECA